MNSTNSTAEEAAEAAAKVVSKADGYLAAGILVFTILAVVLGGIYLRSNKTLVGLKERLAVIRLCDAYNNLSECF
jgi:hypothetical protein